MQGEIKFWNPERFFGFIVSERKSYFFHGKNVTSNADFIQVGDVVQFDLQETDRGPRAIKVELMGVAAGGRV